MSLVVSEMTWYSLLLNFKLIKLASICSPPIPTYFYVLELSTVKIKYNDSSIKREYWRSNFEIVLIKMNSAWLTTWIITYY